MNIYCLAFALCASSSGFAVDCETIFTSYYQNQVWGPGSGPGSDLIQTEVIRTALPAILREFDCHDMVDAPCGDFFWMRTIALPLRHYTGIDIVKSVIDKNQREFGNKFYSFLHLNLIQDVVPRSDIILCRDCLVHLSYSDIAQVIEKFKQSGSTYLLTTSFTNRSSNSDIETGSWRPLNLMLAPFNFPKPLAVINENCTEIGGKFQDKSLVLWRLSSLPKIGDS